MSERHGARTIVLFVRHAHTDAVGARLVARLPGVMLSAAGQVEAEKLRRMLRQELISAVYSSPLERALQTAAAIANDHATLVQRCDGLTEVNFGEWTGKTFSELNDRDDWRRFNEKRGTADVPHGESAIEVQQRIVACVRGLHDRHRNETIAAVSHADVIRPALLYYTGQSLDAWQSIDIELASVSAVALDGATSDVLYVNRRAD